MSDLIKYEMYACTNDTVAAYSGDTHKCCADGQKWYKAEDVDSYIESLKNELAEQKSINNDLLYEVDELHRRSAIQ